MKRFAALVAVVVVLSMPSVARAVVNPTVSLSPPAGPPTTQVTVTASGFVSSDTVKIRFDSVLMATATATFNGTISTTFRVPKWALPGDHIVTAKGVGTGTGSATFTVRSNWARFQFDDANTGFNPFENAIGPNNVSLLQQAWTASPDGPGTHSSPTIAGGTVFVINYDKLLAYDEEALRQCFGTPLVCHPMWVGPIEPGIAYSAPQVAKGVVYVTSLGATSKLYAFKSTPSSACAGKPRACPPLWTASLEGLATGSPVVVDNRVYVTPGYPGHLQVFSAAGTTGCSGVPKTCQPLWTSSVTMGHDSTPAVVNGTVYVGSDLNRFYAFSAAGTTNCSGSPKVCEPLWTAKGDTINGIFHSPVVYRDVVYAGSDDHKLYAFSATGANCKGVPLTCKPLWRATADEPVGATAAANGVVYARAGDTLSAFSVKTTECSTAPKTCEPLWSATASGGTAGSPSIANGLVYLGAGNNVEAFSADGSTNCSGVPKVCTHLWSASTVGDVESSPAIVNGAVYVTTLSAKVYAFAA